MQNTRSFRIFDLDPEMTAAVAESAARFEEFDRRTAVVKSLASDLVPEREGCVVARLDAAGERATELLKRIFELRSALTVVFLADRPATKAIVRAIRHGAVDVLEWPADRESLGAAMEQGLETSRERMRRIQELESAEARLAELTGGEREVLQLLLEGKVNKSIVSRLGIALRTVEARRKRVFAKLGTRNLADIAGILSRAGLLGEFGYPPFVRRTPHGG
jgi:FixJ family two-component response regulator